MNNRKCRNIYQLRKSKKYFLIQLGIGKDTHSYNPQGDLRNRSSSWWKAEPALCAELFLKAPGTG